MSCLILYRKLKLVGPLKSRSYYYCNELFQWSKVLNIWKQKLRNQNFFREPLYLWFIRKKVSETLCISKLYVYLHKRLRPKRFRQTFRRTKIYGPQTTPRNLTTPLSSDVRTKNGWIKGNVFEPLTIDIETFLYLDSGTIEVLFLV